MKRATIVFLLSVLIIAPRATGAQTLDELRHPLLAKGQTAITADYDTYAIEHVTNLVEMHAFEPRHAVLPMFALGLGRNVEMTVSGAYQFPTTFAARAYGSWDYFKQRALVRTVSGDLVARLSSRLEFGATCAFGQARWTSNYARTRNVAAVSIQPSQSTVVAVHGTWLSSAGAVTGALRADLDGLLHPLLQGRRWRIDAEAMARWYRQDMSDSDERGYASDADHGESRDFRLRLGVAHAITDRFQLSVDAYWHPPFNRTQDFQLASTLWPGPESYSWPQFFDRVLGARVDGRWRPVPLLELFATGAWERQTLSYVTDPTGWGLTYRTSTITAGGTWISRRPQRSQPRAADISGLYHPLVELKQLRVDGFAYLQGYRTYDGVFNADRRVYRLRVTTGILPRLQASGYGGALLSHDYLSRGRFKRYASYGGEMKVRVKSGAELYGTLEKRRTGFVDEYPMFVLATAADLGRPLDFLHPDLEGTYTAHLGLRLVF